MENEKLQINIPAEAGNKPVVTILEGAARKMLDNQAPLGYSVEGNIGAVSEFLQRRVNKGQFEPEDCTVTVNREKMSVMLNFCERDFYNHGNVTGYVRLDDKFHDLRINTFVPWSPAELAMTLKMNRAIFKSKQDCLELVTLFQNFTATVNQSIERNVKESGDRTDNFSQVVNSNLPSNFVVYIPIIKGDKPQDIEIETFSKVDGRDVSFILLSPGAKEVVDTIKDTRINEEIDKIREIAPEIAIIEI